MKGWTLRIIAILRNLLRQLASEKISPIDHVL